MTRRDKVFAALMELARGRGEVLGNVVENGFTTDQVAAYLNMVRSNCSAELNALVRAGLVEKITGRPTLYRPIAGPEQFGSPSQVLSAGGAAWRAQVANSVVLKPAPYTMTKIRDDEFDWGVATGRSLHDAVQQAKMALTYPPHGMHVLLLGETGVGKSTFSRRMHAYAVGCGVLRQAAPFVRFNCSEYANNPEILLDQLFGHVRGAYTGAHGDKAGLVEQANEGLLFLDEVHRLPPQGQEMLFHLLDYGTFRRLGETQLERRSRVLLVAATTESPESALLSTFRRRIPVVIRLPALRDWLLYDRYELVYSLCKEEAQTLGMPVKISASALDTLLFSRFSANIGDLKNTVKLACAGAYNDNAYAQRASQTGHARTETIHVLPKHLVVAASDGPNEVLLRTLNQSLDLLVTPDGQGPPPLPMLQEGSRHAKLDRLGRTLYELGFDTDEILESLERELHKQDASGAAGPSSIADLRQFVGEPLFSSMFRAWQEIAPYLPGKGGETAFLRVAVHLYGVIRSERMYGETSDGGPLEVVERVRTDAPELYRLAGRLVRALTKSTGVPLPEYETAIIAMLLRPMESAPKSRVGLVVALFGDAIAKQLVETATRLTAGHGAIAVDIPFQTPADVMDSRLADALQRADEGKGVLLLTDIPRFTEESRWQPPGGIPVASVLRPDLRTVVTALQAIQTDKRSLDLLAAWANRRNQNVEMFGSARKRIVWGCCLTGKGTARAVARLIRDALPEYLSDRVEVIPKELGHTDTPLVPDEGLVATVGSIDPEIFGVPFFSVETLLSKEGIDQLINVLYMGDSVDMSHVSGSEGTVTSPRVERQVAQPVQPAVKQPTTYSLAEMEQYISELLHRDLVFVNPELALRVSKQVWDKIESAQAEAGLERQLKRETFVRFCLHTAYVIERLVKQEGMVHPYSQRIAERYPDKWALMRAAWQPITDVFRLPVNEHEVAYLFELIFAERELEVFDG